MVEFDPEDGGMLCHLCKVKLPDCGYSDTACTNCGQEYDYDEGHVIALSEEQLEALRKLANVTTVERPSIIPNGYVLFDEGDDCITLAVHFSEQGKDSPDSVVVKGKTYVRGQMVALPADQVGTYCSMREYLSVEVINEI